MTPPSLRRCLLGLTLLLTAVAHSQTFLKAVGTELREQSGQGKPVLLRGTNLGGWLELQEWMCPIDYSKTLRDANAGHNGYDFEVRRLLSKRFGPETAADLIRTYEHHWITATDFDHIRALGLNAVRLPFSYATLLHEDGTWRPDAFERLDWCVNECRKRGIYVILDYHAFLPPAANQDGGPNGYFANETQLAETVEIWTRVARHYRDQPTIAFYDLINEPSNSALHQQPGPKREQILNLYDRLYHAIRKVDPQHPIAMEGFWDWKTLRSPTDAGYQNIIYSFHWYNWGAKTTQERIAATEKDLAHLQEMLRQWKIPAYIGEFNLFGDPEAWKHALARYEENGLHWTLWSYKHKDTQGSSWGLYTAVKDKNPATPNLATDSAETIRTTWKAYATTPGNFTLSPLFRGIFPPKPTTQSKR